MTKLSRSMKKFMKVKCYRVAAFFLSAFLVIYVVDISGVLRHMQEKSFNTEFSYPLEAPKFYEIVESFRSGKTVDIPPINNLYSGIAINEDYIEKCNKDSQLALIILIKSAPSNFKQRQAIRETWKDSLLEYNTEAMFFVGRPQSVDDGSFPNKDFKDLIEESTVHKDVVLLDFADSYYNNTIKIMLEMRWAIEKCPNFEYALLVDDDYYVSVKNLLRYSENPLVYPTSATHSSSKFNTVDKLYAGYRMFPPPHRHKIMTKWFVSLEEYPYDYFPPYITAGAIFLSKAALSDIYYASFYTAHFRFDDIYVAICAKKMHVTPLHSEYFRFWTTRDESPEEFLIASHGFSNPERLHRYWRTQRSLGYC